jgi:hypothetical protein
MVRYTMMSSSIIERMAREINDSFAKKVDHVLIFFYVKSHRAIYGVASVPAPIEMRPSPYSPLIFGMHDVLTHRV